MIALTASVMHDAKLKMMNSDFDSFLTKPIKIEKLLMELSKYFPYTSKEPEAKSAIGLSEELVNGNIIQPAELIYRLKNEILPSFQSQKRAMVMEDIGEFSVMLQNAGKDHNVQILTNYATELQNDIKLFDVSAIQKKFLTFKNEIASLINKLEKESE